MVYEIEFILTGLYFILFLSIITIFGFLLIFIINKNIINYPFFEVVLLSLGCGIIFYFFYSYIVESLLIFNFFTILLPIIIINFIGLIFFIKSNSKLRQKLNFKNFKLNLIKNRNEIFIFLLFFIVIFFFQFQIQYYKIVEFEPLISIDPYFWCRNIMYLVDYGHIDYNQIKVYAPGLLFLDGGITLFLPKYRFIFFFIKFAPFFYTSLIIFIIFVLSRIVFKQKFLIFLSMFGFLTLNYFNYRFLLGLPSAPATILFLIFTLTFIDPKIPFYFKGILLAGPILCHSLLGGIAFSIFLIYIILNFFSLLISRKESKKIAYKFLKENFFNFLIFIGFISFYLYRLFLLIRWYLDDWSIFSIVTLNLLNFKFNFNLNYVYSINLFGVFEGNFTFEKFAGYLRHIGGEFWRYDYLFFFFLFYFFIRIKKKNYKKVENFIRILKISIVFMLLYNALYGFMIWFFPSNTFGDFLEWFLHYKSRIFEFGAGMFIFMCVFTIHDIYLLFRKITKFLKKKFPNYMKFLNNNHIRAPKEKLIYFFKSSCKIESILIIFSLVFTYYLFENNRNFPYSYEHQDDNLMELILALGDCEPPNPNTNITILIPRFGEGKLLQLLYRYNIEKIDFKQDYNELFDLITSKNASYIVFPAETTPEKVMRYYVFSYKIFYANLDYIVIKID